MLRLCNHRVNGVTNGHIFFNKTKKQILCYFISVRLVFIFTIKFKFLKKTITASHINRLAIPAILAGVSEPILSLTDAAIVGHIAYNATESLAAIGIVTTFLSMLIWVFGQARTAISALVSQYLGAANLNAIKQLPSQAIALSVLVSAFLCLLTIPFARSIFRAYNASGLLLEYSVDYYSIRVLGLPFTLCTFVVFGTFRGLQNTYYPMLVAALGTVVNIILDVILVYGYKDIIPIFGVEGAALASLIAQFVMAATAIMLLFTKTPVPILPSLTIHPEMIRFLRMSGNLIIRSLALNTALILAASYATSYGATHMAAYTIAINLWFFAAFMIDGYASAGNIIAGKLFGAKQYELLFSLSQIIVRYALVVGLFIAVSGLFLYTKIGFIFTENFQVVKQFQEVFWLVLIMQPLCAITFIFDDIFKGLGQMKTLRNVLLMSTLFVFIPTVLWLDYLGMQLYGIFIAFNLWIIARGLPLIIKFRKQFLPSNQNT